MAKELLKAVTSKDKDGKEIRYSVEEIENGWILTQTSEWKDTKGNYQHKMIKKFFKENPLDESVFDAKVAKKAIGQRDNE